MKLLSHLLVLPAMMFLISISAHTQTASQEEGEATSREEGSQTEKEQVDKNEEDQKTKRAVERALWAAKAVPENAISVSVTDGIVRLEGRVDNMIVKQRAARVAESTRGVISVSNLIAVNKNGIPDTEISANVTQALADDPVADAWDVVVQVDNGVVVLKGTVNSYAEKMAADDIAMNIKGVRDVRNQIRTSVANVEDEELEERIENRLAWNTRIDADAIEVEVENGKVNLTGAVGSAYEQRLAWQHAWIPGVKEVLIGDLEVTQQPESDKPEGNKASATETIRLSDAEIENAVQVALLQNPRVFSFKPEVSVENNIVTLSGTVSNLKARNSAAQTAFNIEGVRRVVNDIAVKPEQQVSDAELEKRASRALSRDVVLEADDNVQVEVENSVVTITGKPDSYFEKMQALNAVATVEGVVDINDQMTVDYEIPAITYIYDWDPIAYDFGFDYPLANSRSDDEIAREISAELRSSPYVDSEEVEVSVNKGVATLNGKVDSWSEYNAAMENVLDAGADKVINRLNVEGSS